MKLSRFIALVLTASLAGMASTLWAEDWTTIDGKAYPEIKVIKVESDAVTILYRDGGARISLLLLPDDLRKRFNYNFDKAWAAAQARAQAEVENARALRQEAHEIELKKEAAWAASETPASSDASTPATTYADPTHHSMSELVDPTHRLLDDVSGENHHSMGSLSQSAAPLTPPPDPNHHTMGGLFGSGDPLSR